jgi:hypothetical protein
VGADAVEQLLNLQFRNIRVDEAAGEITIGAEFHHESLEETRAKVRLVAGNKQRWIEFQKKRESKMGVFACFLSFTYLGIKGSFGLFSHLFSHAGDSISGKARTTETLNFEELLGP